MTAALSKKFSLKNSLIQIISLPLLFFLVSYSHPKFIPHLKGYWKELRNEYYGPIEGIVNTIEGKRSLARINPPPSQKPDLLVATNFEDGAIYSYLNNRFLNYWAPIDRYRDGVKLPDWIIIRTRWLQKEYLQSFLEKGTYEQIKTDYCDLQYENTYLVRTHLFQTPTNCPEEKLILYRLIR